MPREEEGCSLGIMASPSRGVGAGDRIPADINRRGTAPCADQLQSGTWDWCLETTQLRAPQPVPMGDSLCSTHV